LTGLQDLQDGLFKACNRFFNAPPKPQCDLIAQQSAMLPQAPFMRSLSGPADRLALALTAIKALLTKLTIHQDYYNWLLSLFILNCKKLLIQRHP
jgi:hypothetical protein